MTTPRFQKQASVFLSILLFSQCWLQPAWAVPTSESVPEIETSARLIDQALFSSQLAAYDDSPLGQRTPLVLVHGIGGTESRLFHWENFLAYVRKNQAFQDKYKIYLFHYDSTRSVPVLSQDLQQELATFIGGLGGRDIKLLAYSEGGLLTRNAMQDPYIRTHTKAVLSIATPFHGSPLANPEWLQKQLRQGSAISLVRMTHRLAYDIAERKYKTLKEDFHWDNFDQAIPHDEYVRNNGPISQVDYALDEMPNLITYGSYFGLEADPEGFLPKFLDVQQPLPKEEVKPGNLLKKNFLFSMIRNNMGKLPLATTVAKKLTAPVAALQVKASLARNEDGQAYALNMVHEPIATLDSASQRFEIPVSMMTYNDGISPISSTLWLGRFTPNFSNIAQPADRVWAALKSLKGNPNTRLFAGLDHRNWMDGMTRTEVNTVRDLLNPNEQPKTVFEWIVHDLMG